MSVRLVLSLSLLPLSLHMTGSQQHRPTCKTLTKPLLVHVADVLLVKASHTAEPLVIVGGAYKRVYISAGSILLGATNINS